MPRQAPETNGFGHQSTTTISFADRRYDRHPSQSGRVPEVVVLILPDAASGPAIWRASCRAIGPASVADRTELSGAVFGTKITPSEFLGVCAKELTGFARGIRGGTPTAETHVEAGFRGQASGGAR
jgi:hypothetical protein